MHIIVLGGVRSLRLVISNKIKIEVNSGLGSGIVTSRGLKGWNFRPPPTGSERSVDSQRWNVSTEHISPRINIM